MPMLPSASRTESQPPSPGTGSKIERQSAVAPAFRASRTATREVSTPAAWRP